MAVIATAQISITEIEDGAPGSDGKNAIVAVLSNETHTIPTNSSGTGANFTGANSTIYIYNGSVDDSSNWTVTVTVSNVTGSLSGKTYTVTGISADTGFVEFTASRPGYSSIVKRFTLSKNKQGVTGSSATTYWLVTGSPAISKNISGAYTPASLTVTAKSQTGTAAPGNYLGRFIIAESTDGINYVDKYTSTANENTKSYTPSAGIKSIRVRLYLSGGTSNLIDEQVIPIVSDGATGPSLYTWVRYADSATGEGMSSLPVGKSYIGIGINKTSPNPSGNPADYTWSLIKGSDSNGVNLIKNLYDLTPPASYEWKITTLPDGSLGRALYKKHTAGSAAISTGWYLPEVKVDPKRTYLMEFWVKAKDTNSRYYYGREEMKADGSANDEGTGPYGVAGRLPMSEDVDLWKKHTFLIPPHDAGVENSHATDQSSATSDVEYKFYNSETAFIQPKIFLANEPVNPANASEQYAYNISLYEVGSSDFIYDQIVSAEAKLRQDLGLIAPLPTSIILDGSGITAYTSDPNKYARIDYRGLYIVGGAIQIVGGLPDNQIANASAWNAKETPSGAQAKADAAKAAAVSSAKAESDLAEARAKAYADGILTDEEKANLANLETKLTETKNAAISVAASDATTKADAAKSAAITAANAETALAEARAKAYADGILTDEELANLANLEAKLTETKNAAISAAASDATTKATNAQNAAIASAAADATTKADAAENAAKELARATALGKMLYKDPIFLNGNNEVLVYNNLSGSTAVTINRIPKIADCPTSSTHCLEVNSTDVASHGYGGFRLNTKTKPNQILVTKFIAKIPVGSSLVFATNSIGTGGSHKWLTSSSGTGKFEEYIYKVECGTTGTFGTTNFWYINGGTLPLTWYIGYVTTFDLTDNDYTVEETKNAVNDMSNDNKLTPIEKSQLKKEWAAISSEKPSYETLATNYGITTEKTNYINAYNTLNTTLNGTSGYLISMTTTTTVNGATFRAQFDDYYGKKALLIKKINETITSKAEADAKTKADAAESNAKGHADTKDVTLRGNLNLTAPFPSSILMNGDGITAYTADPTKYARLDYRGLYIAGGAIQISGGLPDEQIANAGKWNKNGTYIDQNGIYTGTVEANKIVVSNGKLTDAQIESAGSWNSKVDKLFSMNQYLDRAIIPTGVPVGGIFTGAFTPNQTTTGGKYNRGEINVDGGVFIHPITSVEYPIGDDWEIQTNFESSYVTGTIPNNTGYIMFIGSDKTRFSGHQNTDAKQSFDFMLVYKSGTQWYYDTNANGSFVAFTTNQNDSIVARVVGSANGIDKILPYTVSRNGTYIDETGMYAGTIRFDQMFGGEALLGGVDNVNGRLVVINADGDVVADLNAATGGFSDLYVGNLKSPTVVELGTTGTTITVTEDNLAQVLNEWPRWNNAVLTINFGGNISEDLKIFDFAGQGTITIDLKGYKLNGQVDVQGCSGQYINIRNGTINSDSTDVIDIDRCTYVRLDDLTIYGKSGTSSRAVYCHGGSHVHCMNVKGWNVDAVLASATTGVLSADDCGGKGNQYGLHAYYGGLIIADGAIPTGTSANVMQASGVVLGSYTQPTPPTTPTPPPPPEKTTRWTSNDTGNYGTKYNSWEDGLVKQGNYGYGRRSGYWFFPNTIATTLAGKTIKSAKCYVKRKSSGGSSAKVPIYIKYHSYQDQPSGAPSPLSMSGSEEKRVDLGWGQGAWVTLPSSFYNNLANGTARGLGVYTSSDSKSYYAIMENTCYLEVTYS